MPLHMHHLQHCRMHELHKQLLGLIYTVLRMGYRELSQHSSLPLCPAIVEGALGQDEEAEMLVKAIEVGAACAGVRICCQHLKSAPAQ